jgi:hypothetical protein
MIVFNKEQGETFIYCTPMDNLTSIPEYVYFKFTHRMTGEVVNFYSDGLGASQTNRYAKYGINVDQYFSDATEGMWTYTLQQTPEKEIIPPIGQYPILESGYMYLYPATEFTPTKYDEQSNNFIVYGG